MTPRLGFLGVGWIGRSRMAAMLATGVVEASAIVEPADAMAAGALALAPAARRLPDLGALLAERLDGIVIATPSALHAAQATAALQAGCAVFCQKPLGRTAAETTAVVAASRDADRLLGVDLSYRETNGMRAARELVRSGDLGHVFAADLVFHNAFGPDKPWFYDLALSGGGCVIDLGVHLVDLGLWLLDWPEVIRVDSHLFAAGEPVAPGTIEDYGIATLTLATRAVIRIACSWKLHAGQDAVIAAHLHGTDGGIALDNIAGSFTRFTTRRKRGTAREPIASDDEIWATRAAAAWAERLARGDRFDPAAEHLVTIAEVLDRIYRR